MPRLWDKKAHADERMVYPFAKQLFHLSKTWIAVDFSRFLASAGGGRPSLCPDDDRFESGGGVQERPIRERNVSNDS